MIDRGGGARRAALVLLAALMAVSCSSAADTGSAPAASASAGPAAAAADPSSGDVAGDPAGAEARGGDGAPTPAPRDIVAAAVDDLAGRLAVPPDAITVVLAEVVTWPDNSIGCPLRDREYLEDPVEGTRVHLAVRGELYRYHTGGRRPDPFPCDISVKSELPARRIEP